MASPRSARRAGVVLGALTGGVLLSSVLAPSVSADQDRVLAWERTTEPRPLPDPTPAVPTSTALVEGPAGIDEATPDPDPATRTEAPRRPARAARAAARPSTVRPVSFYRISAGYGSGGSRWSSGRHTGLDLAAPYGTVVRAVAAARVVAAGWDGAYGNAVVLQHADGTRTRYAHLSSDSVRVGERVRVGETIGQVGSTGNATGNHLHLEVITPSGSFTDPRSWLARHGAAV